jgi:Tfp pilus assembly protein PilX
MRRAGDEQGFALISAIMLLSVIIGLGMGLLLLTDNEQRASAREQASEAAFQVAEAALNAQVGQISRAWPGRKEEAYPDTTDNGLIRCTAATSTATNGCPSAAILSAAYPASATSCPAGTPKDAWGSPLSNNWTTYVRNDLGESTYFNSATEQGQPGYDFVGNGKLWVRAVGVAQCRVVTLVTLVSRQLVPVSFPEAAVSGNWFKVTNKGKKVIVNTAGEPPVSQPGAISMRDEGCAPECESWDPTKEQISPNTTKAPKNPSTTLTAEQMAALKSEAKAAGTFHSAATANCPTSMSEISGLPAYVEGCGELKLTNGVANAAGKPGFLALADGTLELKGNAEFFGVIYARNPANSSAAVVTLGGTAQVIGGINVDGNGGILFGSSKANLIYDPTGFKNIKSYAGATPTRNTFRILPINE